MGCRVHYSLNCQDEVTGVDPSVFRRYFREEDEDTQDNEEAEFSAGGYNRYTLPSAEYSVHSA